MPKKKYYKKELNTLQQRRRYHRHLAQRIEESRNASHNLVGSYRKPFIEVKDGYGFYGVLSMDKDSGKVQCHICGGWFEYLYPHINKYHNITGDQYKEKFQLSYKTPLMSEELRESLVKRGMSYPWERMKKKIKALKKYGESGKNHNEKWEERTKKRRSLEEYNKRGTCEIQIVDKLLSLSKKLDRQPTLKEVNATYGGDLRGPIRKHFGGMQKMRELLALNGYDYLSGERMNKSVPEEVLLGSLRDFHKIYKRRPSYSDIQRGLLFSRWQYVRTFGSWRSAKLQAFSTNEKN
jgi:hypothetical protein